MSGQSQKTDLTETEVIIIGVICAVILLSLIIVLIVIICRRRTNAKDYGNSSTTVSRPVPNLQTNGNSVGPPNPRGGPTIKVHLEMVLIHHHNTKVSLIMGASP